MSLQQAIDSYHEILARPGIGEASQELLEEQLRARGLFFGARPICSVLRPRFLKFQQYRHIESQVTILLSAFRKIYERAIADDGFRAQFGLEEWEERLIRLDPGMPEPSPLSRLDAFFIPDDDSLRFTEYNAETPAGGAYGDLLTEIFFTLPVMQEFLRRFEARPLPVRHFILHALLGAYRAWSGSNARPRIGILDWKEVPTYSEFLISAEYFRAHGIETVIADPREVEYRGGKLMCEGGPIDLIYKRVLITELIQRGGFDHPIVRAVADRAVCMVNTFRCKILHKKASLAVLSDERNSGLFSRREQEVIDATIPWTRVVEERRCRVGKEEVELLEYIRGARERLVLKPNDDYGGAGIVLGWEASDTEWSAALDTALARRYIVQERIRIPTEVYPTFSSGSLTFEDRILDTAPFVFGGSFMDGCLTRLSTASLVNVTAGGGSSLATFLVNARDFA